MEKIKRRDRIVIVMVETPIGKMSCYLPFCCAEADKKRIVNG